jgi:hypothetical protein
MKVFDPITELPDIFGCIGQQHPIPMDCFHILPFTFVLHSASFFLFAHYQILILLGIGRGDGTIRILRQREGIIKCLVQFLTRFLEVVGGACLKREWLGAQKLFGGEKHFFREDSTVDMCGGGGVGGSG